LEELAAARISKKAFPYLIGLGILVCVLLTLSAHEMIDAFMYPRLAYGELLRNQGYLELIKLDRTPLGDPGGVRVYELIIVMIIKVTGISGPELAFLPIGGVIVALTYFVLARKLFLSSVVALALALTLTLEPSFSQSMYSVGYHAWVFPLYCVALLSFFDMVTSQRKSSFICMLLSFSATQYIHPVATIWIMLIPLSFLAASVVRKEASARPRFLKSSVLIVFLCFVIINFITTDTLSAFVDSAVKAGADLPKMLTTFVSRVVSTVIKSETPQGTVHLQESRPTIVGVFELAFHLATITPVALYFLLSLITRVRKRKDKKGHNLKEMDLLIWIGSITSLITIVVYLLIAGYPGTKYNLFFFPIISTGAIWVLTRKSRRALVFFVLALVMLNSSKFALLSNGIFTNPSYSSRQGDSEWLLASLGKNTTILSDFTTCGVLELSWSALGYDPSNVRSITYRIYQCLNASDYSRSECSFLQDSRTLLAVDETTLTEHFYADNWQLAPPLSPALENKVFNKIHDGNIIIFSITNTTK
jgi:hypothetical protein